MREKQEESSLPRPFTEEELTGLRSKALAVLNKLHQEVADAGSCDQVSWVRGTVVPDKSDLCRFFDQQGFALVKGFVDDNEIGRLKDEMAKLAEDWDPLKKTLAFRTDAESNKALGNDDYFLDSAERVHFFAEAHALDEKTGALKPQYQHDKLSALNKAGHGMHLHPGAFHDYATSSKVVNLVHELGWIDPVVPQSMYIFKQAHIGGAVNSHQDSTFLYTTPRQSCLGLWLALHDSTLENGCLWVRPKSHHEAVRRQFRRNPLYFAGDSSQEKMLMTTLDDSSSVPWEGLLPDDSNPPCKGLLEAGFVPIECKAGDLLCFCGELDHLSLPNFSASPRHTFQLHLVEGPAAGVTWADTNWLQYPKGKPFLSIKKK